MICKEYLVKLVTGESITIISNRNIIENDEFIHFDHNQLVRKSLVEYCIVVTVKEV